MSAVVEEAKALVMAAGYEPEFALVLGARAQLLLSGDTPTIWRERTIVEREIPVLLTFMAPKVGAQAAAKLILRAMTDAGNLESSTQETPKTMKALNYIAANGRPNRKGQKN